MKRPPRHDSSNDPPATPRRPKSIKDQLLVARAQLRAFRMIVQALPTSNGTVHRSSTGERFIQIVSVGRGYASILHALDESGQVWELQTTLADKVAGKPREILSSKWIRTSMERAQ